MKWCVWSGGSWVWLVVMTTTLHRTQARCENGTNGTADDGAIRLQEAPQSQNFTLGRVEVCVDGDWRTVCDEGWDEVDARVACRQIVGYPTQAFTVNSTALGFGQGSVGGITNLTCTGNEATLMECVHITMTTQCSEDAGVVCCTVCPPPSTSDLLTQSSTHFTTALGGGLGILSAVIAILLVGVVLGWVWSSRRWRGKSGIHEREKVIHTNPTHSPQLGPKNS